MSWRFRVIEGGSADRAESPAGATALTSVAPILLSDDDLSAEIARAERRAQIFDVQRMLRAENRLRECRAEVERRERYRRGEDHA